MTGFRYKGYTARDLTRALKAGGEDAQRRGRAELVTQAEIIKDISVEQAPVDEGDLEAGHRVVRRQIGPHRTSVTIEVSAIGTDGTDYSGIQHESVEGVNWNPGPKTLAKRSGSPRYVGPKFLERAMEEHMETMSAAILAAAFSGFKGG